MREVVVNLNGVEAVEQQRMLADSLGAVVVLGAGSCNVTVNRTGTVMVTIDGQNVLIVESRAANVSAFIVGHPPL